MTILLTNNTGMRTGYLAGRFPGKIGNLFSPGAQRGPYEFCDYALDNGAFIKRGDQWSEPAWLELLEWAKLSGQKPLWCLVPDEVGDAEATLRKWDRYAPVAARYGWPLALAVQDGMELSDIPCGVAVVFVGGSYDWKWRTMAMWCEGFPHVHVGRVNSYHKLWVCADAGARSIDGTGWMRGSQVKYRGLLAYLKESTGIQRRIEQGSFFDCAESEHLYQDIIDKR